MVLHQREGTEAGRTIRAHRRRNHLKGKPVDDQLAREWYTGLQIRIQTSSILWEEHAFLDTREGDRFRVVRFAGKTFAASPASWNPECGVVDMTSGRLLIGGEDDCFNRPLDVGVSQIIAEMLRCGTPVTAFAPTSGRHVVVPEYNPHARLHLMTIRDTMATGAWPDSRSLCYVNVDPDDPSATTNAAALLAPIAASLDAKPFDWRATQRRWDEVLPGPARREQGAKLRPPRRG